MGDAGTAQETFRRIVEGIDPPSYVVTTAAYGDRAGCYVGFATQCSIEPPRFMVCLSKLNHTYQVGRSASALAVHILREGDGELGRRFGSETGDDVDKFAGLVWRPGLGGAPVLDGLDWFGGPIFGRLDVGDHVAFVVAPEDGECRRAHVPRMRIDELREVEAGHPISEER